MKAAFLAAAATLSGTMPVAADTGLRLDLTINLTAIITVAVMTAGGIAAWVTVRMRVAAAEKAITEMKLELATKDGEISAYAKRLEEVRAKGAHELSEFKLHVATTFATNAAIAQIEERLIGAIDRLGDRLDNHFSSQAAARAVQGS